MSGDESTPAALLPSSTHREKRNWLIHVLYTRQEYPRCLELIEEQFQECNGLCEYPIYIKGLILRQWGRVDESLTLFQAAVCLNPQNASNLKQVGRSWYLLGKHTRALEIFAEAAKIDADDWEIYHNKGMCHMHMKDYDRALECFSEANAIQRHDATFMQIGQVYQLQRNYEAALDVYQEALEFSSESTELLTTIGLLYLRLGENMRAFDYLGNSLTHDNRNAKTILAAGSILQDQEDTDVALSKYRVAAVQTPNSSELWNNIGMCFFAKQKTVAAIACLKRAFYLSPFEWIISYNLGLVHLSVGQHASAFHYFSSTINLKQEFPASYMYLAITLARMDDFDNACSAYERSLELDDDYLTHLNYAITLSNYGEVDAARQHLDRFHAIVHEINANVEQDPDVEAAAAALQELLAAG